VLDVLVELSKHDEIQVRLEVVRALRNSNSAEAISLLEEIAGNDSNPSVSAKAFEAIKEKS
ncbi:MAG: HEAT repeat domain-containing protein, partial [Planctomycetota bacterium]|nr:HEAT repeat domain-containing protein [Planctomycetota bacterium]